MILKVERDVSFTMTFIHEGIYPYLLSRTKSTEKTGDGPVNFFPTREAALDTEEWKTYQFSTSEAGEAWNQPATWLRSSSKEPDVDYPKGWFSHIMGTPIGITHPPKVGGVKLGHETVLDHRDHLKNTAPQRWSPEIAGQRNSLLIEFKPPEASMGNKDILQDKNQPISAEKPDGITGVGPFQPGEGGFYLLDEAASRKEKGMSYTIPEYLKTNSTMSVPESQTLSDRNTASPVPRTITAP